MTHKELERRIEEDIPFVLHVADGRSYEVPHEDFIHLPGRSSVVFLTEYPDNDDEDSFTHIIPLLMVSGVSRTGDASRVRED